MKLVWVVGEAPTGKYRSFSKRAWPMAYHNEKDGEPAVAIYCEDSYYPEAAKTGSHAPLIVRIADHSKLTEDGRPTFRWRKLKGEFATLKEAKEAGKSALERYPEFHPKDVATSPK